MDVKNVLWFLKYKKSRIEETQWFFTSHNGDYSDNSKALSETVHLLYPEIRIVWGINKTKDYVLPSYIKSVVFQSEDYYRERAKSKVLIDNVYCENAFVLYKSEPLKNLAKAMLLNATKKKQKCYGLWHGTPLKKMGRDQCGNEDVSGFICNDLTLITGNNYTSKIMAHLSFDQMEILSLGLPRNDILFSENTNQNEVKSKLRISADKKVLLYAPTFRNDGKDTDGINLKRSGIEQLELINIDSLLTAFSEQFGGDWIFVCRFHYHVSSVVDWDMIKTKYQGKVVCGNISDDMADYLKCADALITDYSSVMFDFALTGKPCFLFAHDLTNYECHERGFYIPFEKLPFPAAQTNEELLKVIKNFDKKEYTDQITECLKMLGNTDDGKASKRIANYIYDEVYDKKASLPIKNNV